MDKKSEEEESIRKQNEKFAQEQYTQIEEKQNQTYPEVGEDATQYGEFISTYFAWIPLPNQKEKAGEMAKMTKGQNGTGTECTKEEK